MENLNDNGFRFYIVHYLAVIFLIFLVWIAYIKIVYPFWNSQPVFHSYDFWRYWASVPFILNVKKGQKPGKFCDFDRVLTVEYLEMPTEKKMEMVDLLQCHYICDESAIFIFHLENLEAYHSGHVFPSLCSFYYGTMNVLVGGAGGGGAGGGAGDISSILRMDACISSRSIQFKYFSASTNASTNSIDFDLYFMDFICLRRDFDVTISRKLMATHCWRTLGGGAGDSGGAGGGIRGAIFRKEGEAFPGICPFLSFKSFFYDIHGGFARPLLPVHFILVSIHAKNAALLTDFLLDFDNGLLCMSSIGNLMELVRKRMLFIYMICRADEAFCLYIFRDTRTQYDKRGDDGGALLQFVGSLHKSNSRELFYRGFMNALHDILSSGFGKNFRYLMADNVGDNGIIVSDLREPFDTVDVNYYGYNLVVPTVNNALFIM
jgi:hypothetical protein